MRAAGEEEDEATGSRPPVSVSSSRCSFLGGLGVKKRSACASTRVLGFSYVCSC